MNINIFVFQIVQASPSPPPFWETPSLEFGFIMFLLVLALAALVFLPRWQVPTTCSTDPDFNAFNARNEARKTLTQILGGIFVLVGLYFTWQNFAATQAATGKTFDNAQKSFALAETGQTIDRLTKAVEEIGKNEETKVIQGGKQVAATIKNIPSRVGGIYALEAIAREQKDYHWEIVEILTAYIRQNNPATNVNKLQLPKLIDRDIDAAVKVLRQRDSSAEQPNQVINLQSVFLSKVSFTGAVLNNAKFTDSQFVGVDFSEAHLRDANFENIQSKGLTFNSADLERSFFSNSKLPGAQFQDAHLAKAAFLHADLTGADFSSADLKGAKFQNAVFDADTNFQGADLTDAIITWEQIKSTQMNDKTKLPPELEAKRKATN
jgi:uncharacterized protein YjbI with pentapeptide repeats